CPLLLFCAHPPPPRHLPSFPTRRSSDLVMSWGILPPPLGESQRTVSPASREARFRAPGAASERPSSLCPGFRPSMPVAHWQLLRSEEHTSELQSLTNLVCRLLLEKKTYT